MRRNSMRGVTFVLQRKALFDLGNRHFPPGYP